MKFKLTEGMKERRAYGLSKKSEMVGYISDKLEDVFGNFYDDNIVKEIIVPAFIKYNKDLIDNPEQNTVQLETELTDMFLNQESDLYLDIIEDMAQMIADEIINELGSPATEAEFDELWKK